jgi:AcrR family transcriptional regulator
MPEKLAASAFALFSEQGINAVSLDAAAAHVTKGSPYWHYDSKDALIKAACAHFYRDYHRRILTELARFTHPVKRLERMLEAAVSTCLGTARTAYSQPRSLASQSTMRNCAAVGGSSPITCGGFTSASSGLPRGFPQPKPSAGPDFLLSAMEGLKLRAHYEPHLYVPACHKNIVAQLKRVALMVDEKPVHTGGQASRRNRPAVAPI